MQAYRERLPGASLFRWVESGWWMQSDEAVTGHSVPPDGCVDIVYDRASHNGGTLRAIGAMTIQQRFDYPKGVFIAGVRFRPGMAGSFLGVRPVELTDGSTPLEDLWSRRARELKRKLDDANSIQGALEILLSNLPVPEAHPTPTQRAIEALAAANGSADLEAAARQANLSQRQFRRRCLEASGLTPKHLCRVLRFRHALRIAGQVDRVNWSEIALEAEYFDQAHLIRDFRQFTGHTPMAVFSNTRGHRSG
jgi:AraC-like DNA-binding protein